MTDRRPPVSYVGSRVFALMALGSASVVVGVWMQWVVLGAVGVALAFLILFTLALRFPSSAIWRDLVVPRRVTRGDPAQLDIQIDLNPAAPRWVSALSEVSGDRSFVTSGQMSWPIDTSRRGEYLVGPTTLEAGDPFGLRWRILATREQTSVLVVPRVLPVSELIGFAVAADDLNGETAGSDVFHSLREYVVGDPMKAIHWRSSARAGTLMVKRTVDTTIPWLLVVLDVNSRAYDKESALFEDFDADAFEESVDTVASWAWHSCGSGQRVLLTTTAQVTDPSARRTGVSALTAEVDVRSRDAALDLLALVNPQPADYCGPARVDALLQRNGVRQAILITGRHTEYSALWVRRWSNSARVKVVVGHA